MEKEILIKIEGENWKNSLDKAFKKLNKDAKIDGFRPGKAPKELYIKKYGMTSIYMEAAEMNLDDAYKTMLEKNGDEVIVAQPKVEISAVCDDYVEFKFTLTLKPTVKLGKYTSLGVKKEEVEVTKEEIESSLNDMRERYIENVDKEGTVALNDVAVIDFEGFVDGVSFEGGKGENYSLKIGSHTFIPGFEEQLIGLNVLDEKEIKVTFPEDYHASNLKGKEATFKVKIKELKEQKLPELDEDFFNDLGMEGINTKEALEKQLEENIKARKEAEAENKYIDNLLAEAAKNTTIDIPEVMIEEEIERIIKQYEEQLKMQGITLEMFYKFTASDEQALKEQVKGEAKNRVTYRLMLEEIASKENIEITDSQALEEASSLASKYQMDKDEFLKVFGGLEMVKYDLKMHKAIEILKK